MAFGASVPIVQMPVELAYEVLAEAVAFSNVSPEGNVSVATTSVDVVGPLARHDERVIDDASRKGRRHVSSFADRDVGIRCATATRASAAALHVIETVELLFEGF